MTEIVDTSIGEELKRTSRRIDTLQKTVDLLFADRAILEDILSRLSSLEQSLLINKNHQVEMNKDVKAEIREVKSAVEDKLEESQDNTITIKATKDSIFDKLQKVIGGEK